MKKSKDIDPTKKDLVNNGLDQDLSTQKEGTEQECNTQEQDEAKVEKDEMTLLQDKLAEKEDSYLRLVAEYDNYRKRTLKEKAELIRTASEAVLVDLLSVVDDYERGLDMVSKATDIEGIKEGMQLVYAKIGSYLQKNGLKEIPAVGELFNEELHEAITSFPAPDPAMKGKVIDCVQKGYTLHEKVVRYAKVVVGE